LAGAADGISSTENARGEDDVYRKVIGNSFVIDTLP
jgi:hypothetical protein